jgi:hypothetical protein
MRSGLGRSCCWLALFAALGGCDASNGEGGGALIEGRWVGELESGYLLSGSTTVSVEIERARTGEPVVARVTFGEDPPPAAPTDPDVGWPEGLDPFVGAVPVADGFVYEARDGSRIEDRVRIELGVTELWQPWCELQTPYVIAEGSEEALCLPNRAWTATTFECFFDATETEPQTPVDCLQLTLCRRARVCDCLGSTGCTASQTGMTMALDLTVSGDRAFGAISWMIEDTTSAGTARVQLARR